MGIPNFIDLKHSNLRYLSPIIMKNKLKLFKQLGTKLGISSVYFLKRAFSIRPVVRYKSELAKVVLEKTGIPTFSADRKHSFVSWEIWKELIQRDWSDKKKYIKDFADCDNFSSSFCARMSEIYDLNTAGRLFCTVYDKDSGEKVSGHVAVLIVDKDQRVFLLESQTDRYLEIANRSQRLVIGNWRYVLNYVRFN